MLNLAAFAVAALLEIAGCFAFWAWLRQGRSPLIAGLGVLSLIAFALVLARTDSAFAGRAYAAYGGIYIASALAWMWAVEGQRPTAWDVGGSLLAIVGAIVITLGAAARRLF